MIHSLQILDNGNDVARIEVVRSETLKVGARMYFGRATIADADDHHRVLALIEGQGASIGDVPPGLQKFDDDPIEHIEDSPDLPPIWQVFGGSRRDDGHWTLPELRAEFSRGQKFGAVQITRGVGSGGHGGRVAREEAYIDGQSQHAERDEPAGCTRRCRPGG